MGEAGSGMGVGGGGGGGNFLLKCYSHKVNKWDLKDNDFDFF